MTYVVVNVQNVILWRRASCADAPAEAQRGEGVGTAGPEESGAGSAPAQAPYRNLEQQETFYAWFHSYQKTVKFSSELELGNTCSERALPRP